MQARPLAGVLGSAFVLACASAPGGFPPPVEDLVAANVALGDPHRGRFPLADATAGLPGAGRLRAILHTDEGPVPCELFVDDAPLTVANFVGLARARRPFLHEDGAWKSGPFYEGSPFHRAFEGQFVQTGRHGRLEGGGFLLQDEIGLGDSFDRPGVLAMGNTGTEHSASTQFFVTTGPAPQLAGQHTVFGQCDGEAVLRRIERRVLAGDEPRLRRVEIRRDPT